MSERPKVLVIESSPGAAMPLANAIRQRGWDALAATDAATAMAVAMKSRPDAVVLNTDVAGGGLVALKRLRASAHTAVTPVVAMGRSAESAAPRFLEAGAQECLPGTPDPATLCARVQHYLGRGPQPATAPADAIRDAVRLDALRASGLLDTPAERSFDRVTRLVTRLLGVPVSLLSLVDKDRQFFKSQVGMAPPWSDRRETPLTHSFCQWVVSGREKVAIDDARAHPLLKSNLAIRDLGVVAYAGMPVYGHQGQPLGSLCAIDSKPRPWDESELQTLHDLTTMVEACIAQAELARLKPGAISDFDRYVEAAGAALAGAVHVLRRERARLATEDVDDLLDVAEEHGRHLVQLNRLIQIGGALH